MVRLGHGLFISPIYCHSIYSGSTGIGIGRPRRLPGVRTETSSCGNLESNCFRLDKSRDAARSTFHLTTPVGSLDLRVEALARDGRPHLGWPFQVRPWPAADVLKPRSCVVRGEPCWRFGPLRSTRSIPPLLPTYRILQSVSNA